MEARHADKAWLWLPGIGNAYDSSVREHVLRNSMKSRRSKRRDKGPRAPCRLTTEFERERSRDNSPYLVRLATPSHSLIFHDLFQKDFLRYGLIPTQTENSFMEELGFFESRNPELDTLRLAARASASVFHATLNNNPEVKMEGMKLGVLTVNVVQRQIARLSLTKHDMRSTTYDSTPTLDLVSAVLTLAFYECVCGTSETAWINHCLGAESLMLTLGPERCQLGFAFSLFRCMRYAMLQPRIITVTRTALAREPWTTVPYLHHEKDEIDTLTDILLCLPDQMISMENIKSALDQKATRDLLQKTLKSTLLLKSRLKAWSAKYDIVHFGGSDVVQLFLTEAKSNETASPSTPSHSKFPDLYMELKAKWHMGMLLVHAILAFLAQNEDLGQHLYNECLIHATAILNVSVWVDSQEKRGNHVHLWHILLPLAVVSMACPEERLRASADAILEVYGRDKALGGVVTMNRLRNIFGFWNTVNPRP